MQDFVNSYGDAARAEAYARLEFAGTYYLAYRDLPALLREHVSGSRGLDFGCGTGRSTRFLRACGFEAVGIDIAADMVARARAVDPAGNYRVIADGDFDALGPDRFDVVLAAFTFDNVPVARKPALLRGLTALLRPAGKLLLVVSAPDIYTHEWASFSTRPFPDNWHARPGDIVRTVITGIGGDRPVDDIFMGGAAYRSLFAGVGLAIASETRPTATGEEPFAWVAETTVAPWVVYVLRPRA